MAMSERFSVWERPVADEIYLIAGWHQWADAGAISSGLPRYLIERLQARKIGEIRAEDFYLFQIPGAQFLRPEIKLENGYRKELRPRRNDFYYTNHEHKGLMIFLGDEPHMNIELYAQTFFRAAKELRVKRIAVLGGVYASTPYDKDRSVSCVYSLPRMRDELAKYAVRFSNYEGNVSISSYLTDQAEREGVEYFTFYSFVPAYDFSQTGVPIQGLRVEQDYRAWHEIMRRLNYMFDLGFDLSDLAKQSDDLVTSIETKIEELKKKVPQLRLSEYMEKLSSEYEELSFMPLDDIWERELSDLFRDL
jgi:predicted ATP-grasp superfamily ATP-dependent carboligase